MGQPQRQLLQLSHLSYQPPSSQYPLTDTLINRWQASARRDHHPPILVSFDGSKERRGRPSSLMCELIVKLLPLTWVCPHKVGPLPVFV